MGKQKAVLGQKTWQFNLSTSIVIDVVSVDIERECHDNLVEIVDLYIYCNIQS